MNGRRTQGQRVGLSRERVLDAALRFVDENGLAALSMRKLANALDVEAMSLYNHIPDKEALRDGLVERVFDAKLSRTMDDVDWQEGLRRYATSLRNSLLAHPAVLPLALSRPAVTEETLRTTEKMLNALCAAGFLLGRALDALNSLTLLVVGHATSEAATATINREADRGSTAFIGQLSSDECRLLTTAATKGVGIDDESRFHFAVDSMINGFAMSLAKSDGT